MGKEKKKKGHWTIANEKLAFNDMPFFYGMVCQEGKLQERERKKKGEGEKKTCLRHDDDDDDANRGSIATIENSLFDCRHK